MATFAAFVNTFIVFSVTLAVTMLFLTVIYFAANGGLTHLKELFRDTVANMFTVFGLVNLAWQWGSMIAILYWLHGHGHSEGTKAVVIGSVLIYGIIAIITVIPTKKDADTV